MSARRIFPNFLRGSISYTDLGFAFVAYPNRDSTPYKERYNIPEAETVLRGVSHLSTPKQALNRLQSRLDTVMLTPQRYRH